MLASGDVEYVAGPLRQPAARLSAAAPVENFEVKLSALLTQITPLPFKRSGDSIVSEDICIAVIEDDGGYEAPAGQHGANADYLVHAANVLPALVEAVTRFIKSQATVERLRTTSSGRKLEDAESDFIDAWFQISAALKAAEEVKG